MKLLLKNIIFNCNNNLIFQSVLIQKAKLLNLSETIQNMMSSKDNTDYFLF